MTKLRGSESSERSGPPFRHVPEIPEPKTRERARYRVVLINEAGSSRQIELTPSRLRFGLAAVVGVIALVVLSTLAVKTLVGSPTQTGGQQEALSEKVRLLEEELRKKELAMAVQEKQLKQAQELSSAPAEGLPQPLGLTQQRASVEGESRSKEPGPLRAIQPPVPEEEVGGVAAGAGETRTAESGVVPPIDSDLQKTPTTETALSPDAPQGPAKPARAPLVSFNAESVTAVSEASNSGTLRFRLVKDRPDIRFAGYLFVYVEMVDQRGDSKMYVYPQQARRGEGDLPKNYREGERIAFKYYSKVELPYADIRPGAKLGAVSILLYGENGKIVFQRGFDKAEVKLVTSRASKTEGQRHRSGTNRRAL